MTAKEKPKIPLPKDWTGNVRSAVLHVISLAQYATAYTRSWAANSPNERMRLKTENGRLEAEVALLTEEIRIKDKVKIAEMLARASLHLGSTTVGRIVKEPPAAPPVSEKPETGARHVTAKHPNHVWNVDLTTVPISGGFWVPWSPFTLPQCWPFCWWVAIVLDHYSRRVMGFAVFSDLPSSEDIQAFLDRTIRISGASPKHLISDKGGQFWCDGFKAWCRRRTIKPRFGAVGKHGSIAVIERFIGTMKREGTRRWLIPMRQTTFQNELTLFINWYHEHRPNSALDGCTPYEVYHALPPANRQPRCEPRSRWPRKSRCAKPQTLVAGKPGDEFTLKIDFVNGRQHLPIVTLNRAA